MHETRDDEKEAKEKAGDDQNNKESAPALEMGGILLLGLEMAERFLEIRDVSPVSLHIDFGRGDELIEKARRFIVVLLFEAFFVKLARLVNRLFDVRHDLPSPGIRTSTRHSSRFGILLHLFHHLFGLLVFLEDAIDVRVRFPRAFRDAVLLRIAKGFRVLSLLRGHRIDDGF